ncbi:MAG: LysR family transcriptional regulator [Betaproteobacteria bacterium]|nr:MAG: LysR family transcriptional regulator [Betaproteobacteria bacterium]TAG49271.1 MAG: LysR family transcriptional regulator [Betaproteobacteria bacterium]
MKISFEALEMLDAIDRMGSFARAAEALDRVPSALSYAVRKLEDDLDILLFDRRAYRAKLTQAGRLLLDQGRLLIDHAENVQREVAQTANGWESELRVALDAILPWAWLQPHIEAYYKESCATRLRFSEETLAGSWDALAAGRVDMVIGATGEVSNSALYSTQPLFDVDFAYCVSPKHALARATEPIQDVDLRKCRAIVVADTSRNLPLRTTGLLSGQDTLVVPSMQAKIDAQIAGLGGGYLATWFAKPYLRTKALIEKETDAPKRATTLVLAWKTGVRGNALKWWRDRLRDAKPPR